jgi:HEAT repeat protein
MLLALAIGGCNALRLRPVSTDDKSPAESTNTPAADASATAENAAAKNPLDHDWWDPAAGPEPPLDPSQGYRWRHRYLETLMARPDGEHPDLVAAFDQAKGMAATNAAILLARSGDGRGRDRLIETIRGATLRLPQRCAAAEALAALQEPSPAAALRELVDRYGEYSSPGYLADLHAELLYGLAAHVDAGQDARFISAVKSPASAVRLAAVRGWLRPGKAPLPDEAADLRTDQDYRVRAATLSAMVARGHPLALQAARNGVTDYRLEVRLAAIAALGSLGGDEAQHELEQLDREPEVIRAAAILAFAQMAARDLVWAGAESPSWHVRRAVAIALKQWPDAGGVLLARRLLLEDPSIEVQKQVLITLAAWPLAQSGPVLLEAMDGKGYLSRKTAAAQLAERWSAAREFTPDAPAERRAAIVAKLRDQLRRDHGVAPLDSPALASTSSAAEAPPLAAERIDQAAEMVGRLQEAPPDGPAAAAVLKELSAFDSDLPGLLTQLVDQRHTILPDAIYQKLLPQQGGGFAELDRLLSPDVQQRRRAMNDLVAQAGREPLSGLALARLSEIGMGEPDTLVWAGIFHAILTDGREPAVRLAYAGLGHGDAEVRRMAADYLAAHPSSDHARLLLPALDDKNYAVVLSAVKALGHPGLLLDPAPLERLLSTNDRPLRLAVARSLAITGAASGPQTLELLAHETDADTRRRAAQAMGGLGDRRYAATLIGLLDDTLGVRTAALAALPNVVGRDVAYQPANPATSTLDQVERWKKWWQAEGSKEPIQTANPS